MHQHQLRQPLAIFRPRQDADQHPRPVLLHLQRTERDVERAGFEQALHRKGELLGRGVIQVGLDLDHTLADQPQGARDWLADEQPHGVWPRRLTRPEPVADALDPSETGWRPNRNWPARSAARRPVGVVSSPVCSGVGSARIGTPPSRISSSVAGAGTGRRPCCVLDPTRSERQTRAQHARPVDLEQVQSQHHPDHVDDGVDRANLVELHGVDGRAVDRGFDLGQPLEDLCRALDDGGWKGAATHDAQDVGQAPMRLIGLLQLHAGPRAAQTVLANGVGFERPTADGQRLQPARSSSRLTPASSSAPSSMSPATPLKQST